ncbi:hypothetical protein CYY_009121 [Polysphondylium violaceum]|uniref:Transmembrane protein n=1 Tax=Polysphondylium violaceum TaxID=133409 RepID=A0A8J4PKK1_9MYCE|nr:hypothetical protein CYY_009121 [Polysphondylium violaceum]
MKGVVIAAIIIGLVFGLPLSITCVVLGARQLSHDETVCDFESPKTHLSVAQYLVGLGASSLGLVAINMFFLIFWDGEAPPKALVIPKNVISALFATSWMIVGAITLFQENKECISGENKSTHVQFATAMWALTLLQVVFESFNMCSICKQTSAA